MKGTLLKTIHGWYINEGFIPLYPHDATEKVEGKEVEYTLESNALVKDGVIVGSEVYAKLKS